MINDVKPSAATAYGYLVIVFCAASNVTMQ